MSGVFRAVPGTTSPLLHQLASLNPANPFYTPQYIGYKIAQGCTAWLLTNGDEGTRGVSCPVFMKTGRLRRSIEIPSMPAMVSESFWQGLLEFCRGKAVTDLSVNSFCSESAAIPPLCNEKSRKARWEYTLDLKHPDTLTKMRKGHSYNVKRARKMGVKIRRGRDLDDVLAHARLIGVSMQRRKDRGENVTTAVETEDLLRLTQSGVGEIFQAMLDGEIISSNVILNAQKCGYNHTQGTSPKGMDYGAAHFLIHEIACALREEGKEVFNLGGTDDPDPESGLVKFKTGFGAATKRLELEAARFAPGSIASGLFRRLFLLEQG